MTHEELTAILTPHEDHPLAHTCRRLFDLVKHWKGTCDNLRQRDVDAAVLQKANDDLRVTVWRLEQELEQERGRKMEADLPKSAEELVAFLKSIDATVYMERGRPSLRITPGTIDPILMGKLRPLIVKHRDAVMAGLDRATEARCGECGSLIDFGVVSADDVFDNCRRSMCPYWRAGHPASSDGFAKQRSHDFWKRSKDAERAQDTIPE